MKLEFVGQSTRDPGNIAANPSRLVNMYREPVGAGGRARYVLRSVPGVIRFAELNRIFVRKMVEASGLLYAVSGGHLYQINPAGTVADLGLVDDDPNTSIAANNGKIAVTGGGKYWVYNGTTLDEVATAIGGADSCDTLGGYTLAHKGRVVQWSQLVDAATMPALNVKASETTDEDIIRGVVIGDRYVIFKASSHESWRVTGQANANAFALIVGSQNETGLRAYNLIALFPNGAGFCGSDGRVHVWSAGAMQPVSTPAVEAAMDLHKPLRMFFYERRGHAFMCVTLEGAPAWCYDLATGEWHERADGVNLGQWRAVDAARLNGAWLVGYDEGYIGKFTPVPKDIDTPLKRVAVSRPLETGALFTVPLVEVYAAVGYGRDQDAVFLADQGISLLGDDANGYLIVEREEDDPASIIARFGRNNMPFGGEKPRSLGPKGRFDTRTTWRGLGQYRTFVMEISMTSPVDVPIYADCMVEVS